MNFVTNPYLNLRQPKTNATNVRKNFYLKMDSNLKLLNPTSAMKIPTTVFVLGTEPRITFASLWTD